MTQPFARLLSRELKPRPKKCQLTETSPALFRRKSKVTRTGSKPRMWLECGGSVDEIEDVAEKYWGPAISRLSYSWSHCVVFAFCQVSDSALYLFVHRLTQTLHGLFTGELAWYSPFIVQFIWLGHLCSLIKLHRVTCQSIICLSLNTQRPSLPLCH